MLPFIATNAFKARFNFLAVQNLRHPKLVMKTCYGNGTESISKEGHLRLFLAMQHLKNDKQKSAQSEDTI